MASLIPDLGGPLRQAVGRWVDFLVIHYGDTLDAFGRSLIAPVLWAEAVLMPVPPEPGILAVFGLAWLGSRRLRFAVAMAALATALALLGLWQAAMQSLALIVVAVAAVALVGLPLGVAAARSRRLSGVLAPFYDVMQTIPSFVYLIPVAMLLGLGRAPALVATFVYALPPLARLTELGLREVEPRLVEGARALGLSRRQALLLVELPLARPAILQGLNQSIMMALGMVVVASMIGAKGLGEVVLLGLQRADPGLGLVGGLGIVVLAMLLDRMARVAWSARGRQEESRSDGSVRLDERREQK